MDGIFVPLTNSVAGGGGGRGDKSEIRLPVSPEAAGVTSKEFIEAEMALFLEQAKDVNIIITTLRFLEYLPRKLITSQIVAAMKKGSTIVDLAADAGVDCEATKPGELYTRPWCPCSPLSSARPFTFVSTKASVSARFDNGGLAQRVAWSG
ncbi:hypothetical protein BJ322DRAFT_1108839 [Thelephora terrestris]|uniref:proton-translocating NAD(P)(+) transhydrogenase n=1 Tax=Thelephora terrestris TaxID=56493 RepID=A0A9P6HED0_9AGAM|nr:hypothetical protein BJ322DRAFT_1108839 [Thelephora terrestris]